MKPTAWPAEMLTVTVRFRLNLCAPKWARVLLVAQGMFAADKDGQLGAQMNIPENSFLFNILIRKCLIRIISPLQTINKPSCLQSDAEYWNHKRRPPLDYSLEKTIKMFA